MKMTRRMILALVFTLALSSIAHAQTLWVSQGVLVNPAINAILADTGQLESGQHVFSVFVASTVQAVVFVEWRDPTDTTTLKTQAMFVAANSNTAFVPGIKFNTFNLNDKIRVRLNAAVTGSIQASIFVE